MNRRLFLGGAVAIAATGIGGGIAFARRRTDDVLRVGVMMNLTHAPLLAGLGSGRIAQALAPTKVETLAFRAGPRVSEALLGGAIDAGTAGSAAIVIHHARHAASGGGLRVVSGCASGGASFMVSKSSGIRSAADLRGKRLAVTQIGTTQDVALRAYLRNHGLVDRASGGDVTILAVGSAVILDQMRRGDLHGAWLAEPWATRLESEIGATRFVDERDLWPERRFSTAALATRSSNADDPRIALLSAALGEEVTRARTGLEVTLDEAYAEMKRHVGNPGSRKVFSAAARFVDFTSDPIRSSFARFAADAAALGFTPGLHGDHGLFRSTESSDASDGTRRSG
jgi:NitT/TauT family transport system substrate-binding protein